MAKIQWIGEGDIPSTVYVCWNCGKELASNKGWFAKDTSTGSQAAYVCICHQCQMPTLVWKGGDQTPGIRFGNSVEDISDESVKTLYEEARSAMQVNSYTCVVLACRKLLMHIAVDKGAKEGQSFIFYVDYLAEKHYIPPDAKEWVDKIRTRGNEANHEIKIMKREEAEELVTFRDASQAYLRVPR